MRWAIVLAMMLFTEPLLACGGGGMFGGTFSGRMSFGYSGCGSGGSSYSTPRIRSYRTSPIPSSRSYRTSPVPNAVPKLDFEEARVPFLESEIHSVQWIKIKTSKGFLMAPVINGLMPQPASMEKDEKGNLLAIRFIYTLKVPLADYERDLKRRGYVTYVRFSKQRIDQLATKYGGIYPKTPQELIPVGVPNTIQEKLVMSEPNLMDRLKALFVKN